METKEHIDRIIRKTFEIIQSVYENQKEQEPFHLENEPVDASFSQNKTIEENNGY